MPATDDFNGLSQFGAGEHQLTCRGGRRWSVADAYLHPVTDRPNLTVRTGSAVTGVLVEGGRAVGVGYRSGGGAHSVRAEREVLLCAGTIATPQLLMLSGVGPADHLREQGIPVVLDAPGVGANLHDHPTVPLSWTTRGATDFRDIVATEEAALQWQQERRGPLTSVAGEAGMFFATDGATAPTSRWPPAPPRTGTTAPGTPTCPAAERPSCSWIRPAGDACG
jgi:choline dehydrogenase